MNTEETPPPAAKLSRNDIQKDLDAAAQELAGFLEAPEKGATLLDVPMDPSVLMDHSVEQEALKQHDAETGIHIPEIPTAQEIRTSQQFDANVDAEERRRNMELPFQHLDDRLGEITVEPEERANFLRSALHGDDLYFNAHIPGLNVDVKVRMAKPSFTNAMTLAIEAQLKDRPALAGDWLSRFQFLSLWLMVEEYDGRPTAWYGALNPAPSYRQLIEILTNEELIEKMRDMPEPQFESMLVACYIAEKKLKKCLEALTDRSFFATAATD